MKRFTILLVTLICAVSWVQAQPMDPQMHGYINEEVHRQAPAQQSRRRGPSAAEVRAWHEREAKIQARIARNRATPWYMAIINDFTNNKMAWAGGYATQQRAVEEALKHCKSSSCKVLATFSNSCAVVVAATSKPKSDKEFFIGIDKDDNVAASKAWQACQAVYGDREDRCFYSTAKTKNGTAFCTGYDYSIYGQR